MFCALVRSQSSMYDNYPSTLFRFEPRLEFRFPPGFILLSLLVYFFKVCIEAGVFLPGYGTSRAVGHGGESVISMGN